MLPVLPVAANCRILKSIQDTYLSYGGTQLCLDIQVTDQNNLPVHTPPRLRIMTPPIRVITTGPRRTPISSSNIRRLRVIISPVDINRRHVAVALDARVGRVVPVQVRRGHHLRVAPVALWGCRAQVDVARVGAPEGVVVDAGKGVDLLPEDEDAAR